MSGYLILIRSRNASAGPLSPRLFPTLESSEGALSIPTAEVTPQTNYIRTSETHTGDSMCSHTLQPLSQVLKQLSQDMQTTEMSIDRGRDKEVVVYIYTMEYYSAIKKNEIMPFAATWIQLEIIILSEESQKEKDKYHMMSLICEI